MNKFLLVFCCLTILASAAKAQQAHVTGAVADTGHQKGIANAVVALLTPGDSVLYRFARTDANGNYSFGNIVPGNYILMTTHPYFADYMDNISVSGDMAIPRIALTSKSKLLEEVIVKSGNPIRIKGDTTVYTADSFKVSANANVEELLKKLPGIQVDKNGKITAMGEQVTKVLVDGEEFFGDDPGMAVKNLRADAVKEVQVFDKKSDQATFTGVDDGKTEKTINLKLKEDRKHGYFGKIDMAGGLLKHADDRYNSNIMLSSFKGKRKITGFLLTGNTGQDGLSWQDNEKFGGENENISMSMDDNGDVSYNWTGGNRDDEPEVNTENGFIRNINAGVQYSNKWNDKHSFNFSPKYNNQIYTNGQQRHARTDYGDSALVQDDNTRTYVNRYNVKTSLTYDLKIDSVNSVKITAKANFYHTESTEDKNSASTGNTGTLKNSMNSDVSTNSSKQSLFGSILFRHKFKKQRRTLSLNADWTRIGSDGTVFIKSFNQSYYNGLPASSQAVNQQQDNDKYTQKFSAKLSYTEPLSKKYSLELSYELSGTGGKNNQFTYTYSPVSDKYDVAVDSLTNNFRQSIIVHKPAARVSYSGKKLKFNFGGGIGLTHFNLRDMSIGKDYGRNYTNFFPSASLNYAYKSQHNLRAYYNGNTTQPTINQLQPLRNNNDYFNQYIGNPNLKPAFSHSFGIGHNLYNFLKDIFTYQSLNFRVTSNAITNERTINLDSGKTVTRPINTNGNYSISLWSGVGFKVKKIDTRFNINPNLSYNRYADVFNGVLNHSDVFSGAVNVYISKEKEKKYAFSIYDEGRYNSSKISQGNSSSHYFTNMLNADAKVFLHKTFSVQTDIQYYTQQKTQQLGDALSVAIWNARIEKTFKKDEFTCYLLVRDLLNQNRGIERSFDRNTFNEVRNDRLQRYWMLGFSWNFKNKGAQSK